MNATNLTITTLLDLTAASAHPAAPTADGSAFDALLQPPSPPELPASQAQSPLQHQRHPYPPPASDRHHRSSDQPARPSAERAETSPAAVTAADADSAESSRPDDEYPSPAPDSAAVAETLIEQSLAAVAQQAASSPVAPPSDLPISADGTVTNESSLPAADNSTQRAAAKSPTLATAIHSTVVAEATASPLVTQPDNASAAQPASHLSPSDPAVFASAASSNPASPGSAPQTTATTFLDSPPSTSTLADASVTERPADPTDRSSSDLSLDPTSDHNSIGKLSPVDAATAPTPSPAAAQVTSAIAPSTAPDRPINTPDRSAAQEIQGPAPASRNRLPGQLLAQAEGPAPRRGASEIDGTRLINRVARAFAAAQERDGEVRLRLSPPELGALRLELRIQDGVMIAHLEAETEAAQAAIVENLPALRERLAEQGIRIERFDVDLMQRHSPDSSNQSRGGQEDKLVSPPRAPAASRRSSDPSVLAPTVPRSNTTPGGLNVIV